MNPNDRSSDEDGELGSLTDDLDQIRSETASFLRQRTASFLRQRLILWAVRWCIGFTIIWVVVSYWPNLDWLWWAGAIVALASLAFLLIVGWLISRRLNRTSGFIAQAKLNISEGDRSQGAVHGGSGDLH